MDGLRQVVGFVRLHARLGPAPRTEFAPRRPAPALVLDNNGGFGPSRESARIDLAVMSISDGLVRRVGRAPRWRTTRGELRPASVVPPPVFEESQ